ncbi:MAG: hypothetical protein LAN37_09620 [Acidobacteriia bacterium]|nr:hypothetical protein [Terriglobia bacterium]
MISRDIRNTEANVALAKGDFEYLKQACQGFPALIAKLERELDALKEEERQFRSASRQEQRHWKCAGDKAEGVPVLGSSKLLQLATREDYKA